MNFKNIFSFTIIFCSLISTAATASIITPTDMTGLRSFDGGANVLLLSFDAVKSGTEDRTIAHFDISSLTYMPQSSIFDIPIDNIDPGLPGGIFEVYAFAGDGVVSIDEWNAGSLIHTFYGIEGGYSTLSFDITTLLQNAYTNGDTYLSFNFRAGDGTDRFWLSDVVGIAEPTITSTVPVPAAFWLFVTGLSLFYGFFRKNQH